jgi:hypothetical protein
MTTVLRKRASRTEINEARQRWGSFFYSPEQDALRVPVRAVACEMNEWLTYEFTDRQQNSATARLKWEKMAVPFKIAVPNGNELYVKKLRESADRRND